MKAWRSSLRDALISGAAASALSTEVLGLLGARQARSPVGPISTLSDWPWGDAAPQANDVDVQPTLAGCLAHTAALIGAGITAALAATIDDIVTPKRLTSGHGMRLKSASLIGLADHRLCRSGLGTRADTAADRGQRTGGDLTPTLSARAAKARLRRHDSSHLV